MATEERCVCCGAVIPEGQQVCDNCMNERSDQWKRGGICEMCRRRNYCRKQCSANRKYASARIREYIRNKMGLGKIRNALQVPEDEQIK